MARRIVITSGKGGVGKTTISYLLGESLARNYQKVVILDIDIGLNNLDVVAGIDRLVNFDLIDVVENRCRTRQALVQSPENPRLYFLPCMNSYHVGKISPEALLSVLGELDSSFDFILIDCPAGIGFEFHRAVFCATEAIVITTPHLIAIRDAGKVINLLSGYTLGQICLIVNRVRGDLLSKSMLISPEEISNSLKVPLLGVVSESTEITLSASRTGALLNLSGEVMSNFNKLAENLQKGANHSCKYNLNTKIKRGKL